jgi:hypothetical protein
MLHRVLAVIAIRLQPKITIHLLVRSTERVLVKPTSRRLFIAIVAWLAGFVAAVLVLLLPMPEDAVCPPGEACALQLVPRGRSSRGSVLRLGRACSRRVFGGRRGARRSHNELEPPRLGHAAMYELQQFQHPRHTAQSIGPRSSTLIR